MFFLFVLAFIFTFIYNIIILKFCKHLDKYYPNLAEHIKTEANNCLPLDIRVLSCEKAKDKFHARLNAHSKVYEYRIDNGEVADIFNRKYLTRIDTPIDIEKLKAASKHFLGNHDFQAFCANKHMKKSTVRTINSIDIRKENGIIYIRYDGDGFLRNMVRIITGTIVDVALGKIPESDIDKIFESKVRANAAPTAPPEGLFLVEVRYN